MRASRQTDPVVLTGDTHPSWANDLPTDDERYRLDRSSSVGVEFVCPSITSDGGARHTIPPRRSRRYRAGMTRPGPRRILPAVRFLEKVAAFGSSELDCWEWGAKRDNRGLGVFWDGHKGVLAHRFSYEMWIGPIPAGLLLDHLCGNPACVRPDHLEPFTRGNGPRGQATDAARAQQADQTHCAHGHPLPEERLEGRRRCRPCASRRSAQYRARRRG